MLNLFLVGSDAVCWDSGACIEFAMVPCLEPILNKNKNKKLHTLCTINYDTLEEWLSPMERFGLDCYHMVRSPVQSRSFLYSDEQG